MIFKLLFPLIEITIFSSELERKIMPMGCAVLLTFLLNLTPSPAGEARFRELLSGQNAAYGTGKAASGPEIVIARDAAELRRLWTENVTGSPSDTADPPAVNWEREFVIAVFVGTRPTAGHSIKVTAVSRREKSLDVTLEEKRPPRDAVTAQVITSPYTVIACGREGCAVSEIVTIRLRSVDGAVLAERTPWEYRFLHSPGSGASR